MSILFISSKGGNCTTVTAAAYALHAAHSGTPTLLIDLCGDVPAVIGMPDPTSIGINEWLSEKSIANAESLVQSGTSLTDQLTVIHRGSHTVEGSPRWNEFAAAIRDLPYNVIVDAGTTYVPDFVRASFSAVPLVTRACYLSLRRATQLPRPTHVVVIKEEARALTVTDVSNVLGVPVMAEIPYESAISRAVDAGLLSARSEQLFARHLHDPT